MLNKLSGHIVCRLNEVLPYGGGFESECLKNTKPYFVQLAREASCDVVLDFLGVKYIDGAGVGTIAHLYRSLRQRGRRLFVYNVSGQPFDLLSFLGISSLLSINY